MLDLTQVLSIGGPVGVICTVVGFLINAYITKKKDDREEVRLDRESESGIVETTRQALKMARDEMAETRMAMIDLRREHDEQITKLKREHEEAIAAWARRVGELEAELRELRTWVNRNLYGEPGNPGTG